MSKTLEIYRIILFLLFYCLLIISDVFGLRVPTNCRL
jgi:hypothetical protein